MEGSDFEGTSPKLFWPETLVYLLPGAELTPMLTLIVAIMPETPCEPELLLFAGMNGHLHAAGLLEHLRSGEPTPKIWEAIQTLFAAMNEVQEMVASDWDRKQRWCTRHHQATQACHLLCNSMLILSICHVDSDCGGKQMAASNRELEPVNLRLLKSEMSHALKGFYELADILIVLMRSFFWRCPILTGNRSSTQR